MRGLLEGMNFQLGDKLLIAQINVGEFTELPRAVSHHMLLDPAPRACFKGACIHEAGDLDANSPPWAATVNQIFLSCWAQEWWDTQPEAGPKELRIHDPSSGLEIPVLRVCTWCGDVPVVGEMATSKFAAGSETALRWEGLLRATASSSAMPRSPRANIPESTTPVRPPLDQTSPSARSLWL